MKFKLLCLLILFTNVLLAQDSVNKDTLKSLNISTPIFKFPYSIKSIDAFDIEGNVFKLDSTNARPFVINTWSTTCQPCVAEIPAFNALYELYKGCGVAFYAMTNTENKDNTLEFLKSHPYKFKQLVADFSYIYKNRFAIGLPTTLFVDGTGKVVYSIHGGKPDPKDQGETFMDFKKGLGLLGCK